MQQRNVETRECVSVCAWSISVLASLIRKCFWLWCKHVSRRDAPHAVWCWWFMSLTGLLFMTLVSYEALVRRSSRLVWIFVSCGGRLVLPQRGCCCCCRGAWSLTAPRSYLSAASLTRSTGSTGDTVLSAQQLTLWWWEDMADKRCLCLNWFGETRGLLICFDTCLNLLNIWFTGRCRHTVLFKMPTFTGQNMKIVLHFEKELLPFGRWHRLPK